VNLHFLDERWDLRTPSAVATKRGHVEVMKHLLDHAFNSEVRDDLGYGVVEIRNTKIGVITACMKPRTGSFLFFQL
jgi:hypothetical protein